MAFLTFRLIIIDLTDRPDFPIRRETDPSAFTLHFVNLGSLDKPEFELRQGQSSVYRLSPGESAELVRLMQGMTVSAPRKPVIAFDGPASELLIRQHGSDLSFRWHIERPDEWESVGKLFEYAAAFHIHLANPGQAKSLFRD
ncbi:MAG: hypothetical protein ACOYY3_06995 [Chloroflexota bacterium]